MIPPPRACVANPVVRRSLRGAHVATLVLTLLGNAAALGDGRHVLWTIEGERNTVYLLGSLHVLRPQDGPLPAVADAAYADAEKIVMEIDMDEALENPIALVQAMQGSAMLPEGQSLREILGPDYARVAERTRSAGVELSMFDRFAPWFVALTLLQIELAKRDFRPELGIEHQLATRAVGDGKPVSGLETVEQQLAVFSGLSLEQQKRMLLMTLEETAQLDSEIEKLITAWRDGDVEVLAGTLSAEYDEFPELYGPLTENRNRAWVPQIVDLLDDADDYLVVVGTLHLVGRNSVVDLLEQRGHKVRQQ